jgi:hypothetical protein
MSGSSVLVGAGLAGLVVVMIPTVRGWDTRRPPPMEVIEGASWLRRLAGVIGRASALLAAGVVSGVLVLGLGLRLMMRVAAAVSPESAQGRLTDADEVVGEVTLGGTMFLVLGVGVLGGMVATAAWVVLRRWLPERSVVAGLVVAAVGAGLLARPSGLIDPDNRDFVILSPTWLPLLMSVAVVLAFGVSFAVLADRWSTRWPVPAPTIRGVLSVVPFVGVLTLSVPMVVPAVVMVVAVSVATWRQRGRTRSGRWLERSERPGRLAVRTGAVAGGMWVGVSVVQVLAL